MAPAGTVTTRLLALAEETLARTDPKKTTFDDAIALKFAPAMVTSVPTAPDAGKKLEMTGTAAWSEKKAFDAKIPSPSRKTFFM